MSKNNPLRAVLIKSFNCCGTSFNKGEIYDIAEFRTSNGKTVVYLKSGPGLIAVMPSTILILAPESQPPKSKKNRFKKKNKIKHIKQ